MNAFVSTATHGRIPSIVTQDIVADPTTVALLVNAVYFKVRILRFGTEPLTFKYGTDALTTCLEDSRDSAVLLDCCGSL